MSSATVLLYLSFVYKIGIVNSNTNVKVSLLPPICRATEQTSVHDNLLCCEVIQMEPYRFKSGNIEHGNIWTVIANNLHNVEEVKFTVKQHSVMKRYDLLYPWF